MATVALKCPYLAQFTLQQVRASAQNILNVGATSCPFYSTLARRSSFASGIQHSETTPIIPSMPFTHDEIMAVHKRIINEQKQSLAMRSTRELPEKHATVTPKQPYSHPYGDIIISTECQDLQCPFLKKTPITLKRISLNEDTIEINENLETPMTIEALKPKPFEYQTFFTAKIDEKKRDNSYRIFKRVQRRSGLFPQAEEKSDDDTRVITIWCSNDYLGLGQHPKLKRAVIDAVNMFGSGSGGTRNISGSTPLHDNLEKLLARLHQKEAALLFTSCYVANDTTLFTLAKLLPSCHIFSDSGNHASMIQGIKNSQVPKHIFRHNDIEHLEYLLKKVPQHIPKIVAFETVHSMDGSICDLEAMIDVAHQYGSITFIDEVHAVGLYGENGAGVGERDHILHKMDIISGTLGKAFGSIGGYIAGTTKMTDFIRSYGSGFIFTTSLPPTVLASATAAVEISMSDEGRYLRRKQQENARELRSKLVDAGLPVMIAPSHIIPIHVGNAALATELCNRLLDKYSIYIQSINYPTVARGTERLRIAPTPHHTSAMIDYLVQSLTYVWQDVGLQLRHQNEQIAARQHM
ncbi:unnamed protein product [Didymodactylos carnosus]|uniref:5-aminolevulinate synthase n=1 Tax=Didymodactylos carnosus TaxID=1234261 RepID=A0A814L0D1_9BILA|nr:unnamed protein product [Didymodactylos carnosus]CAF1056872.1 unnamed protein product [Didymodactylos carnosus]CAF3644966.1 unnamed protein product [Didymodactylos carnosus]CAF3825774.1 unnamed protein product [Didymodactylos carnosus]